MNDINWLHAIHYYCDRLLELWPGKVALGTALAAILTALGIDHVLFGVLLASVMGEMLTRIIVHCKRGKSLCLVVLVTGGRTRLEKTVEDAVEGRRPRPPYRDDFAPPFRSGQPLDDLFMDTPQAPHREPRPCPPPRPRAPGRDDSLMPHTGGDGGHTDCGGGDGCGGGE